VSTSLRHHIAPVALWQTLARVLPKLPSPMSFITAAFVDTDAPTSVERYERMLGHDLTTEERRQRSLRNAAGAPVRHIRSVG
jgi:hypothetical protein